jgi:hypothetical protein
MVWVGSASVIDNALALTTPGRLSIASAGTVIYATKDFSGAVFTTSSDKRIVMGSITYQIA